MKHTTKIFWGSGWWHRSIGPHSTHEERYHWPRRARKITPLRVGMILLGIIYLTTVAENKSEIVGLSTLLPHRFVRQSGSQRNGLASADTPTNPSRNLIHTV